MESTQYAGFTLANESGDGVQSLSVGAYAGSSTNTGEFTQEGSSTSAFEGVATSNGLVGRTEQYSISESMMTGTSINTSTESREGLYADVSLIGTLGVTDSDSGSSNGNNGNHFGNDGDNGNSNGNSGGDSSDNLGMDFSGNGIVGVEFGSYSTESYATTTAEFGSDSTAETYSVSSYDI